MYLVTNKVDMRIARTTIDLVIMIIFNNVPLLRINTVDLEETTILIMKETKAISILISHLIITEDSNLNNNNNFSNFNLQSIGLRWMVLILIRHIIIIIKRICFNNKVNNIKKNMFVNDLQLFNQSNVNEFICFNNAIDFIIQG